MSTNSQFLFTFTDEFTTSEWVEWSEGVLADVPDAEFHTKTGFQRALDTKNAGPRTRANEAYRSGYLRAPLVDSRFSKPHPMPLGWLSVIYGKAPHSTLGFFAYIIGRALQIDENNALFKSGLNDVAAVQILHIGFRRNDRWYSTVALFEFVRNDFETQIGQDATQDEILYLAAALINTVEGPAFAGLLDAYGEDKPIETLHFMLEDGKTIPVKLSDIPTIAKMHSFDLGTTKRKRAHRYWARPERGIYTRAVSAKGKTFIAEFAKAERERYLSGQASAMAGIYESIESGNTAEDIFELAPELFSGSDDLLDSWQELDAHLRSVTRSTIKSKDFKESSAQWKLAQNAIFGSGDAVVSDQDLSEMASEVAKVGAKKTSKASKAKPKKEKALPSADEIAKLVAEVENLVVEAPKAKEKKEKEKAPGQRVYSSSDRADQDRRNSNLGVSGEEFVYLLEKQELNSLGLNELAENVIWASKEIGDGLGYDILSYDENGDEIFIEVKTTRGGPSTPFYISANEIEVSKEKGAAYRIYRLFSYPKAPNMYIVNGPLDEALDLTATNFRAMPM